MFPFNVSDIVMVECALESGERWPASAMINRCESSLFVWPNVPRYEQSLSSKPG
jgi:hypothetical protein